MKQTQNDETFPLLSANAATNSAILAPLFQKLEGIRNGIIVLDGPCGSGKTTLASVLAKHYGAELISMDDFFLPPSLRAPERLQTPGGNIHWERFLEQVLLPLQTGTDFQYEAYNCQSGGFSVKTYEHKQFNLIEGSYSHHPAFQKAYGHLDALKVFLSVPEEEQLRRLQQRNPERFPQFVDRWIPLEKNYFRAYDIEEQADLVLYSLPYDDHNHGKEE